MPEQLNGGWRNKKGRLAAIAVITLLVCLFYTYVHAFRSVNPGFVVNGDWEVIIDNPCNLEPEWCEANQDLIQNGDKLLMIGTLSLSESQSDKRADSLAGLAEGDTFPITLERDGEIQTLQWRIPIQATSGQLALFVPALLVYLPFWFVGTYVLLFIESRDTRWLFFVSFNYVTALWLAIGMTSSTRSAWSALVVSALSWLLVPIYIHLHLQAPAPLRGRSWRRLLAPLYTITAVVIVLELLQLLPFRAYAAGLVLALVGSIVIMIVRLARGASKAERLATRIMLLGIGMAFGPGIILWLVPTVLLSESLGGQSVSIAILAIPVLPLFYAYAIYKRRLGVQETIANRALSLYGAFLLYFTVVVVSLLAFEIWTDTSDTLLTLSLAFLLAFVLTLLSIRGGLRKLANRIAYGTRYEPDQVIRMFAARIPAATDRAALVHLLADEIAPTLLIRQSALLLEVNESVSTLYNRGVTLDNLMGSSKSFRRLLDQAGQFIPNSTGNGMENSDPGDWVRLVVPVTAGTRTNGAWLFGERDPDSFYSQSDIALLVALANQVAIAIENGNLLNALQHELKERMRVQASLQSHAERLQLLREIDRSILVAESGADIARVALARIRQLIPCLRASVVLFDFDASDLQVLATQGSGEDGLRPGERFSLRFPASAAPLVAGELWCTADADLLAERHDLDSILGSGVSSFVCAPIMDADRLIGALSVVSAKRNAFTGEHAEIVSEVANSVAVAYRNAHLVEAVQKTSRELQQLSARLITAQEMERQHISNELHDEMGQMLTGITLNLAHIQDHLPESTGPEIYEKLVDTTALLSEMMEHVRELSHDLRPAMLRDLGLVPTLRWYVNKCATRYNLRITFDGEDINGRLPSDTETVLFRVAQEALTNVARHAAASHVNLLLEDEQSVVRVIIEDDGRGFDKGQVFAPDSPSQGAGLVGMRERVYSLGGKLDVSSEAGHGTRIEVELPLEDYR